MSREDIVTFHVFASEENGEEELHVVPEINWEEFYDLLERDRSTNEALERGRKRGAKANQEAANKAKRAIQQINADLKEKRPDMIEQARAQFIRDRVPKPDGGKYSLRRIQELID